MGKVKKARTTGGKPKIEIPVDASGRYFITNLDEAKLAVEKAAGLVDKMEEIARENDLKGKEATYQDLRRALAAFQVEAEIAEIAVGENKSLLVERTGSAWIFTDDQIPEDDELAEGVQSLTSIIETKFSESKARTVLRKITKRVFDPEKLDDAVKSGILEPEEIAPAFLTFVQSSYVQVGKRK